MYVEYVQDPVPKNTLPKLDHQYQTLFVDIVYRFAITNINRFYVKLKTRFQNVFFRVHKVIDE